MQHNAIKNATTFVKPLLPYNKTYKHTDGLTDRHSDRPSTIIIIISTRRA